VPLPGVYTVSADRVPSTVVYGFVLRPKWLLFLASCFALSALFISLGFWQLDRLDQRRAINRKVIAARHAAPVEPGAVLGTNRPPASADTYRKVTTSGVYDSAHEYLVRGRTVDDRTGLYVLTPLVTSDGTALLVVRGWIAPSAKGANVAPEVPAAPSGEVTVVARVRQPEDGDLEEVRVGDGTQIRHLDVTALAAKVGHPTYRAYAELTSQTPEADRRLVAIPEPPIDEGPHLSYAVQWFIFSTMTFIGYGIYVRNEAERRRHPEEAPVSPAVVASGPSAV
jgi:cytochrome oxidase assembly protein ShyY1